MKYVDTHSHIYFDSYDKDRDKLINSFEDEGLDFVVSVGIDMESSKKSVSLADEYNSIYATVGFHPSESDGVGTAEIDAMKKLCENKKVIAVGEIGLDYYRNYKPVDVMKKGFEKQLELAQELHKPVVIHDRDAHKDVYDRLRSFKGSVKGIMHAYSGDYDLAKKYLDLGYYISITGVVTFKKADILRDVVRKVPVDLLLSETDCPFLTPEPYRGKRNQPAYVKYVVHRIAKITGLQADDVAETLVDNAYKAFEISKG